MSVDPAAERLRAELPELELPSALVTGEAVVLDLRPASFATRALAFALDLVVTIIVGLLLLFLLTGSMDIADESAAGAMSVLWVVSVLLVLPTLVETLSRGRSLGKLAAGLRVVRDDGGPVRLRQAFVRALLGVVELYAASGSIALICSLWNRQGKRLGDLLAGTYVVRERAREPYSPPLTMPPELQGWARGADIGRIPDHLAIAARQLLARSAVLNPDSRARLGVTIAGQVARYVAPPPPGQVSPERFLRAVLSERRERDLARLSGLQARRAERAQRRAAAGVLSPGGSRLIGDQDQLAQGHPSTNYPYQGAPAPSGMAADRYR